MTETGEPNPYKLDMPQVVAEQIEKFLHQAYLQGSRPQVVRALKTIFRRLRDAPLEFGELFTHHKHLDLLVHVAVVNPVVVYFAIHSEKRFVIVQKIFVISPAAEE